MSDRPLSVQYHIAYGCLGGRDACIGCEIAALEAKLDCYRTGYCLRCGGEFKRPQVQVCEACAIGTETGCERLERAGRSLVATFDLLQPGDVEFDLEMNAFRAALEGREP